MMDRDLRSELIHTCREATPGQDATVVSWSVMRSLLRRPGKEGNPTESQALGYEQPNSNGASSLNCLSLIVDSISPNTTPSVLTNMTSSDRTL
ncbi:hypothetical protein ElyMa_001263700 [Elysia marginata]|uniref:Uncharacterized protein n=1 Tax=Elysia marginata TaxID=1093978 RepID=A0AAV4IF72_9GAST|nr:hypothetical protein ElyMa_001263700 [Elysia marginata]